MNWIRMIVRVGEALPLFVFLSLAFDPAWWQWLGIIATLALIGPVSNSLTVRRVPA